MSLAGHAAALGVIFWFAGTTLPKSPLNTIKLVLIEEFLPAAPAHEAETHTADAIETALPELQPSPQIDQVAPESEPASSEPAQLASTSPTPGPDLPIPEPRRAEPPLPKSAPKAPARETVRQRVVNPAPKSMPGQRKPELGATAFPLPSDPSSLPSSVIAVPPQVAAVPQWPARSMAHSTNVSDAYRSALSAWLERHKKYPAAARQRGEQGSAVLQFRVDREGRIVHFALARSTGYAELDRAVHELMQGPRLPPFPASMTQAEIEIAVTIRFNLSQ